MGRRILRILPALVALAVGLEGLQRWPLWSAELWTVSIARMPWTIWADLVAGDRHPPGHYLLIKLLDEVADVDWLVRLPSAIGGVLAALIIVFAAERLVGRRAGVVAGLALALSPMFVTYTAIARCYGLLLAVGAALLWASATFDARPRRAAVVLGVSSLSGFYLHYAALLPVAVAGLAALAGAWRAPARRVALRWWLGAQLGWVLLALPWAVGPMRDQLARTHLGALSSHVLLYLLWRVDEFFPPALALAALVALVGALAVLWRRERTLVVWILGALLLPLAVSGSVDMQRRLYVHIGFLPLWAVLVARGLSALRLRGLAAAAVTVLLLLAPARAILAVPSAPFGPHGSSLVDDGVFDARQDAALLAAALPEGRQVVMEGELWVGIYDRYAPGAFSHAKVHRPVRGDWRAFDTRQRRPQAAGCLPAGTLPFVLEVRDPSACEALREAVAHSDSGRHILATALLTEDDVERERLLRQAVAGSPADPRPAQRLARLLAAQDRSEEAVEAVDRGVEIAATWGWIPVLVELLNMRAGLSWVASASGDADAARCAESLSRQSVAPWACLSPLTRPLVR